MFPTKHFLPQQYCVWFRFSQLRSLKLSVLTWRQQETERGKESEREERSGGGP